jgi:uncharacterized protein YjbJ (UPF0337 family)
MNKDRVMGIIDEVAGSAKRKAGKVTENPKLQVEGLIQQAKGKVQGAWGKAKETAHDAASGTDIHLDSRERLGSESAQTDAHRGNSGRRDL